MLAYKKNIDSFVASLAGFLIIFLLTRHSGIGICPDGVAYSTTAEHLHTQASLTDFTGHPFVNFPAFYPFFLSGLMWLTGLRPILFAPVLNASLFAAVIFLAGCIMEQFSSKSKLYKTAILTCIVLSPALLEVYSMLWSETIFILLLLLFMMAMRFYFQSYSIKFLITAAIITSIATVTRYAGITIIATGGILLLFDMKLRWRQKLSGLILFSAISSALLIANLLHNYIVSGTGTGLREKSFASFSDNLRDTGAVFNDWLPFLHSHYSGAMFTAVFFILLSSFLVVSHFIKNNRLASYESISATFAAIYILFMLIISTVSRFETLNSRFLSPVFILLLWNSSSWIVFASKNLSGAKKKWLIALGAIMLCNFQYGQFAADYETWDGVKDAGIPGYTEDQWTHSSTVQYMQKDLSLFQNGYTVYSNAYDAVYFFTRQPGEFLPHKESMNEIRKFLHDRHCYMIWFNDGLDTDEIDMSFILNVKKMILLKQFDDGAIYKYDQ